MKRSFLAACFIAVLAVADFFQCRAAGLQVTEHDNGDGDVEAVMRLLGADTPEAVDSYDMERFTELLQNPVEINVATGSRLVASGLFTQYQVASLLDYRSRTGDILSYAELAAVDGFSQERAVALAPFVSLVSDALPGRTATKTTKVRNDLMLRTNLRKSDRETEYAYGLKYRFGVNDRFEFGLSANRPYACEEAYPSGGSFHAVYYGRKTLGKLLVGDFNLRYGQGLSLWNGFRMSSLSSPESFYLRPSGISPYWSYSGEGSQRGIAADFNIGRFVVSSSVGVGGLRELMRGDKSAFISLMPVLNAAWYGENAQISLTGHMKTSDVEEWGRNAGTGVTSAVRLPSGVSGAGVSADFRWCISGVDLFGETALDLADMSVAAVAGTVFDAVEDLTLAFRASYSADQYSIAAGGRFYGGKMTQLSGKSGFGSSVRRHSGTFSAEASYYPEPKYGSDGPGMQLKLLLNYTIQISPSVALAARLSERLRNGTEKNRTDLRLDLKYASGDWMAQIRVNGLYNKSLGLLGYLEGGWKPDRMAVYFRAGIFRIDSWQDRIYAYERDAPGNFNVPAYYGRGCWGAVTFALKVSGRFKAYLRMSTIQYPWESPTASERTPKSECRVLLSFAL